MLKLKHAKIMIAAKVITLVTVKTVLNRFDFSMPLTKTSVRKYKKITARIEHF